VTGYYKADGAYMFSTLVSHKSVGWLKGEMDQWKGEINKECQEEERKKQVLSLCHPHNFVFHVW
jgi:hypothetical protein